MQPPQILSMGWLEHYSSDSGESKDFYHKVVGWPMHPTDMGDVVHWTAMNGETPVFGLIHEYPGLEDYRGWLPYFVVEDVNPVRQKALEEGATVVTEEANEDGSCGSFCVLRDPAGVLFALFRQASAADYDEARQSGV